MILANDNLWSLHCEIFLAQCIKVQFSDHYLKHISSQKANTCLFQ
jgi:hypothetical protein